MKTYIETFNAAFEGLLNPAGNGLVTLEFLGKAPHYESSYELSCHIGFHDIHGGRAGVALLNINRPDLKKLWDFLIALPMPEDVELEHAATELTNLIVGSATERFSQADLKIEIGLPYIVQVKHQIKLLTLKKDDFHYWGISGADFRLNWVLCEYDTIEFG
ncbi:MAG: chemotaxis protein CheX [Turneriella sp.]|nr:chemotaxis protein CheX [Turneriella sp.]